MLLSATSQCDSTACSDGTRDNPVDEKGSDMKKAARKQLILERETVKVMVVTLPTADLALVRGGDGRAIGRYEPSGGSSTNPVC
jgi:hypothetical protein